MASDIHDTTYYPLAVAPADVWDMEERPVEIQGACGTLLPATRRLESRRQAPARMMNEGSRGLRIDIAVATRKDPATPTKAEIKQFGGAVVKLEPLHHEEPFQANKVIPVGERVTQEGPRELQGEGKDWGNAHAPPRFWLWSAGVAIALALIAALAYHELYLIDRKQVPGRALELVEEAKVDEVEGFEIGGTSEETARSMAAVYAKAKTPEEVMPLIRNAERLSARLKLDWQPWNGPDNWQAELGHTWEVSVKGGICHGLLCGQKPDFSRYGMFFVCEEGSLRIDWEATQGLGDADFATLNRGVGSGGVIRAYLTPETFYSLVFQEAEYAAYKMLAPDRDLVIWGYVKHGTPAETALRKVFEAEKHADAPLLEQAVTLRLAPPPKGAQKNQWLIGEMLHIDWVSP